MPVFWPGKEAEVVWINASVMITADTEEAIGLRLNKSVLSFLVHSSVQSWVHLQHWPAVYTAHTGCPRQRAVKRVCVSPVSRMHWYVCALCVLQCCKSYKIGVMLCRSGQATEEEMYNNGQ